MIKIAVASGKGGTGKTFVSTNIYHVLRRNNYNATLVDCDAEAPDSSAFFRTELLKTSDVTQLVPVINKDSCTFCGKCHEYCNYNAIFILPPARVINVMEDLCHGCGACSVACSYGAITENPVSLGQVNIFSTDNGSELIEARMNIGVMSPVPVIKAAIRQVNNHTDIAILDSPPGTSCPFIQTVARADFVILVTEPTPFGLSDLMQSVETLDTMTKPYGVIINRAGLGNNEVLKYLQAKNIPLLMEIPFNKKIAISCSAGEIVSDSDTDFAGKLLSMVRNIISNYGDSNNQR